MRQNGIGAVLYLAVFCGAVEIIQKNDEQKPYHRQYHGGEQSYNERHFRAYAQSTG
jgi:hypothetical protein